MARIDERAEPDMGEQAGPLGGDLAHQLHDHAAGQHVGFDLVVAGQRLHSWRPDPMAADDPPDHSLMGEAVHAPRFPVADPQCVNASKIAWPSGLEEPLLHRSV
jgi:hypothetical protein